MANLIEIRYKDYQAWTGAGVSIPWDVYSRKIKNERVQPAWVLPEIIQDTWSGQTFDIQHVRHDSYYFQIFFKESELPDIARMKSCSNVIIIEHSKIDGVWNRSRSFTLDLLKSDYLEISEPERVGKTTGWKCDIVFRTRRTVINKTTPLNQSNYLALDGSIYYSIKNTIDYYKDSENITVDWTDGTQRVLQSNSKTGKSILLYFQSSLAPAFLAKLKRASTITINGVNVKEYSYISQEIGEDLIKIQVDCVTNFVVQNFISFSEQNLNINDGSTSYNFYTDFAVEFSNQTPILSQFDNETGVNETSKSITKTAKLFRTFLNGANAFELKKRFELGGTITLNATPVLENTEISPEKIGVDLYQVDVECLIETNEKL